MSSSEQSRVLALWYLNYAGSFSEQKGARAKYAYHLRMKGALVLHYSVATANTYASETAE